MRRKFLMMTLLLILSVFSFKCKNPNSIKRIKNSETRVQSKEKDIDNNTSYKVTQDGIIVKTIEGQQYFRVGMKLSELDQLDFSYSIDSTSTSVYEWGYDGSSEKAKLISKDGILLFACIPALEKNVVFAIIVLSDKMKLNNNISVGTTVKDILTYYPNTKFHINIVTGNEECELSELSVTLVFKTDDNNRIGEYSNYDIENPSIAINYTSTVSYITIVKQKI